jgi:uncharacterized protein
VDVARKRIALTMRKDGGASAREDRNARSEGGGAKGGASRGGQHSRGQKPGGQKAGGQKAGKMSSSPRKAASSETGALGAALMDAFKRT